MQEALNKQKEEDEILAEAKVFRETDKLKSRHDLEKEKMVSLKWVNILSKCVCNIPVFNDRVCDSSSVFYVQCGRQTHKVGWWQVFARFQYRNVFRVLLGKFGFYT